MSEPVLPPTMTSSTLTNGNLTAGTKRKRETKGSMKFYAVRVGRTPGVYYSWPDCLEQVNGFPKAVFKSFPSLGDAQAFASGVTPTNGGGSAGLGTKQCYGVQSGRRPGVYSTWPEVLAQTTGFRNPRYRGFKTWAEAEAYVAEGQGANGLSLSSAQEKSEESNKKAKTAPKSRKSGGGSAKEETGLNALDEQGEYEAGTGPLPEGAEDNFDPTIVLDHKLGTARYKTAEELARTKYQVVAPVEHIPIKIYTDGSALGNGRAGAIAGVGVYFGPKDRRNISEPLPGARQTNQRAELTAIARALDVAPRDRRVLIVSDSNYAIRCVTEWCTSWRRNGWLTSTGKPVENKDLVVRIVDMLEERRRLNARRAVDQTEDTRAWQSCGFGDVELGPWATGPAGVQFQWVKGHAKDEGNSAADQLAVQGATMAKSLSEDVTID